MSLRAFLVAFISTAAAVSSTWARPAINALSPTKQSLTSQENPFSKARAADDFFLSTGNGRNYKVTQIQVDMIGDGTPSPSKFCATIFRNASGFPNRPGTEVATVLGASSVQCLGWVDPLFGTYLYRATFNVPAGTMTLPPNRTYWISGFVRWDSFRTWGFARQSGPLSGVTAWTNGFYPNSLTWLPSSLPPTDLSWRVAFTQ